MKTQLARLGAWFMTAQAFYALVLSLFWIFVTEVMFVSIFAGYTGQTLADAIAGGSKQAELWLITQRLVGVELLPISLLMLFITYTGYQRGQKWSWFALLLAGVILWGSLLGYKIVTGYFELTSSSMTFVIGAALFLVGIILPAKEMLGSTN